jgi:hypothetical protein
MNPIKSIILNSIIYAEYLDSIMAKSLGWFLCPLRRIWWKSYFIKFTTTSRSLLYSIRYHCDTLSPFLCGSQNKMRIVKQICNKQAIQYLQLCARRSEFDFWQEKEIFSSPLRPDRHCTPAVETGRTSPGIKSRPGDRLSCLMIFQLEKPGKDKVDLP